MLSEFLTRDLRRIFPAVPKANVAVANIALLDETYWNLLNYSVEVGQNGC